MASKRRLAPMAALSVGARFSAAQAQTGTGAFRGVDPAAIEDLVLANHILANEKVLDGFGHVSIRDPRNPNRYLMSRSVAPATVTADDIMEYDLDSKPVDAKGRGSYKERFIHGEIYKVRPDVNAVIHSHSPTIVPFSVTKYRLKPILHNAAFLGDGPPVFDTREAAGPTNLLVETPALGKAMAQTLGKANIVLMRGHGDTVVGPNVRLATFRAIYAEVNARAVEVTCRRCRDCESAPRAASHRLWQATNERRVPSLLRSRHVVRVPGPPIIRRRVVAPDLRPLRAVLVPRPRLEIAEILVEHQVDVGEELDRDAVGVLVIDRDVVSAAVADRAPEQLDVLAREEVAGAVDFGFVAQLEREVMNIGVVGLEQIDRVVVAAAAQEGEEIAAPVRDFESEHVAIKLHGRCGVGRVKGDVAELARYSAGIAVVILGERVVGKDFEAGAFRIGEHDRLRDSGRDAAAPLGFDPRLRQPRRQLAEIASGGDLEGEPHAGRPLAMLEHDHLLPRLGGQDRAALLLGNDAQADDARVIIELPLEIGCGQRRMPNSLDLQHSHSPRSAIIHEQGDFASRPASLGQNPIDRAAATSTRPAGGRAPTRTSRRSGRCARAWCRPA